MLEVAAARGIVLAAAAPLKPDRTPVGPAALGRVLAEDVPADADSPPFTKAMMDGYAVRSADCATPGAVLRVIREVSAGDAGAAAVGPGEAARIFTGAPFPAGADAVVMQEKTEPLDDGRVRVTDPAVRPGRNVLDRGREMRAGDVILPAGTVVTSAAVGLLAGVGRSTVQAVRQPRVAILPTGNELVEADETPGPGRIRNTNGPMLAALAARADAAPRTLGIGRDDPAALRELIRDGLDSSDVLVLAGGVSVGKFDLVPDVLRDLGVDVRVRQVRLKPGKPLLFGTVGDVLVFGLPGNPVRSFVCFELFVRPALRKLAGHADPGPTVVTLPIAEPLQTANDRPTYHPGRLEGGEVGWRVRPLPWFGSADLRALLLADALLALPAGQVRVDAGQVVDVVVL